MELLFVFVGKTGQGYMEEGCADYLSRVRRYLKAEVRLLRAEPRKKGTDEARALALEAARLEAALSGCDQVICLERLGRQLSSEGLAAHLEGLMLRGARRAAFVIGGVGGLPPEVLARADLLLSFGPMTFPHELSRLMLLEQVFRALSIRAGEPYHR